VVAGDGVEAITRWRDELLREARADSTLKAYGRWWGEFAEFAGGDGEALLPASEEEVSRFITWLDLCGKGGSMRVALAAIAHVHAEKGLSSLCGSARVKLVADGAERVWSRSRPERVRDLFPVGALLRWVELKDKPGLTSGLWLCDAVLVALGLHTMSRANELASLTIADVVVKGPMMTVCVRRVKTNPLS
jgi:integrase